MTSHDDNQFGDWLRRELMTRNLSFTRFGQMADVSGASVKAWIDGTRNISETSCDLVADGLGVSRNFVRRLANRPDTDKDPIAVGEAQLVSGPGIREMTIRERLALMDEILESVQEELESSRE